MTHSVSKSKDMKKILNRYKEAKRLKKIMDKRNLKRFKFLFGSIDSLTHQKGKRT